MTTLRARIAEYGVDADGQRMDPEWLDGAVRDWLDGGGIVTVMFRHEVVGACFETTKDDDGWTGSVDVINEEVQRGIEAGVYRGLGVEIKNARVLSDAEAENGVICGGRINSVSIVDEPITYRKRIES